MAVALAVLVILAGAMAPIGLRVVQQQREIRTRALLQAAHEASFGARDRRVANARADFGFDPAGAVADLRILVSRTGSTTWGSVPSYGTSLGYLCGWNGPYWVGPITSAAVPAPADAWGRALFSNATYQVVSAGPDGVVGTADDLLYPAAATSYLAYNATVILVFGRASLNSTGTATLQFPYATSGAVLNRCTPNLGAAPTIGTLASLTQNLTNTATQTLTWNVPAGALRLVLTPTGSGSFTAVTMILDLLPGETRQLQLSL